MADDDLGPLIRVHPWRLSGSLTVIGGAFLAFGALLVVWMIAEPPDWSELTAMAWFGMAVALGLMPGLGVLLIVKARRTSGDQVALHAGGLVYLKQGEVHEVRWPQVQWLTSELKRIEGPGGSVTHTHTIKTATGELVLTHGIADIARLIDEVRRRTLEVMLPAARATLERGHAVDFGPIALDRDELTVFDGASLRWPEVAAVDRDAGVLQVWARGKVRPVARVMLSKVRNDHLLDALVAQLRR